MQHNPTPKVSMTPAQFAEFFYNLNYTKPFRFKGREYFIPIYNSNATTELFKTGRQCAKSTYLCHRILTRAATDSLQILYEAPKKEQSITFSRQKLDPTLFSSPKFHRFLKLNSKGIVEDKNVLNFYCFKTGSYIKLSTTFNGVDRDRGLSIDDLYIDEVQDQHKEDIHVLQEALSASTKDKYMAYAGTPKSKSNYIEQLWKESRQIQWWMKCGACNTWQIPDVEYNIREKGLLCRKCERRLDVTKGEWVIGNPAGKFNGWHISQMMRLVTGMPGALQWKTEEGIHGIYDKYQRYSPSKFSNEVLGESYDSAENPLVVEDIKNACFPFFAKQKKYDPTFFSDPIIMGIDWGRNQNNYTVVSICIEYQGVPTIVYMRRFEGVEAEPQITGRIIKDLYEKFKCNTIFCDKGLFWHYKSGLENAFGPARVKQMVNLMDYRSNDEKMIVKSKTTMENRFQISRNEIMNLFVNSIKQQKVRFFNLQEMQEGKFVDDFTTIGYEVRDSKERGERLFFLSSGDSGAPTDAFHSCLYSWLGFMMVNKKLKWYFEQEKKAGSVSY